MFGKSRLAMRTVHGGRYQGKRCVNSNNRKADSKMICNDKEEGMSCVAYIHQLINIQ